MNSLEILKKESCLYKEAKYRSIVKAIIWRFIATATTFGLVLIFTGKVDLALTVGGLEVFLKLLFYFLHERLWARLHWGRHEIQPFVIWITGLSGSGKTTIARLVVEALNRMKIKVDHLDGDTIRDLFPETGFEREQVNAHISRVGLLASRLEKKGVFVVASFLSPYREGREFARSLCENFTEVYLDTPLDVCEKRNKSGLYEKARQGKIKNFVGVDVAYEPSENPELVIDTSILSAEEAAGRIVEAVRKYL